MKPAQPPPAAKKPLQISIGDDSDEDDNKEEEKVDKEESEPIKPEDKE